MSWEIPPPSLRMDCGRNSKYPLGLLGTVSNVTDVPVEGTQGGSLSDKSPEPWSIAVTVVRAHGVPVLLVQWYEGRQINRSQGNELEG